MKILNEKVKDFVYSLNHKAEDDKYYTKDFFTDDERKYYADIDKILLELCDYEVDVPDRFYEQYKNNWHNGVVEYLEELTGIKEEDFGDGDNTYNHAGKVLNDFNWFSVELKDGTTYVAMQIHISGDIRGNYTDCFLLKFDYYSEFYEVIDDVCREQCTFTMEIDGESYYINPLAFEECLQVYCYTNDDIADVYGIWASSDEELVEQIREKVAE